MELLRQAAFDGKSFDAVYGHVEYVALLLSSGFHASVRIVKSDGLLTT